MTTYVLDDSRLPEGCIDASFTAGGEDNGVESANNSSMRLKTPMGNLADEGETKNLEQA